MNRSVTVLLLVLIFIVSCKKNETNLSPAGSISGKIIPAGSCTSMQAIPIGGSAFSAIPDINGNFNIINVPAGEYRIVGNPAPGYLAPPEVTVTVVAGQDRSAGTIIISPDSSNGLVTFTLDGIHYVHNDPWMIEVSYDSQYLQIGTHSAPSPNFVALSIYVHFVSGAGSYNIQAPNSIHLNRVGTGNYAFNTTGAGASGTVNVTSLNTTTRRISGTFSFTLVPANTSTFGTKTVSDGVFTNLLY